MKRVFWRRMWTDCLRFSSFGRSLPYNLEFSKEVFSVGIPIEFWANGSYATRMIDGG